MKAFPGRTLLAIIGMLIVASEVVSCGDGRETATSAPNSSDLITGTTALQSSTSAVTVVSEKLYLSTEGFGYESGIGSRVQWLEYGTANASLSLLESEQGIARVESSDCGNGVVRKATFQSGVVAWLDSANGVRGLEAHQAGVVLTTIDIGTSRSEMIQERIWQIFSNNFYLSSRALEVEPRDSILLRGELEGASPGSRVISIRSGRSCPVK
jgi:hypothetical protein